MYQVTNLKTHGFINKRELGIPNSRFKYLRYGRMITSFHPYHPLHPYQA